MIKLLTILFLAACGSMFGGLDSHLKKINAKTIGHQIRNIDFIYMINLDQRPEKYNHTLDELAPFGITPFRFSAVNGWELTLEDINDVGIKYEPWMKKEIKANYYPLDGNGQHIHEIMSVPGRNYFAHGMSKGAIGIVLSHLSILKDAYDSGYETIWIMEDDIEVIRDPNLLSEMIDKLDFQIGGNNWDFLFTDQDTKDKNGAYTPCSAAADRPDFNPLNPYKFVERIDISPDFRKIGARYGAYSMIVRRSGMKKMLDFMRNGIFLPYDMEFNIPDNITMYNVREDIVSTQPEAFSDNGIPTYKRALIQ